MTDSSCLFCASAGGSVVYDDGRCRVVIADEPFAGFCRVVWKAHVREMTDLIPADRRHLMNVVFATEAALRDLLLPDKVNLASLGNVVPHLHWHVIPRFFDDSHFPNPVWGARIRATPPRTIAIEFPDRLAAHIAAAEGLAP